MQETYRDFSNMSVAIPSRGPTFPYEDSPRDTVRSANPGAGPAYGPAAAGYGGPPDSSSFDPGRATIRQDLCQDPDLHVRNLNDASRVALGGGDNREACADPLRATGKQSLAEAYEASARLGPPAGRGPGPGGAMPASRPGGDQRPTKREGTGENDYAPPGAVPQPTGYIVGHEELERNATVSGSRASAPGVEHFGAARGGDGGKSYDAIYMASVNAARSMLEKSRGPNSGSAQSGKVGSSAGTLGSLRMAAEAPLTSRLASPALPSPGQAFPGSSRARDDSRESGRAHDVLPSHLLRDNPYALPANSHVGG